MGELVAAGLRRSDRPAKHVSSVLRFRAVGRGRAASILGFADRPERQSPGAPLQLKGVQRG